MIVLYIDTSSTNLIIGLIKDDKLLNRIIKPMGKDMSTYSLSLIEKLISDENLKPNDIDKIMVCVGPGSFTGIRIGVTIAKTFAWSLNKDIIPITSLDAMAISTNVDTCKVPIIDARRGYVYAKILDKDNNTIMEEQYINLETLKVACSSLGNNYIFITNDNLKIPAIKYEVNIINVFNFYKDKESVNPHSINPIYLKKTEAEESKNIEC